MKKASISDQQATRTERQRDPNLTYTPSADELQFHNAEFASTFEDADLQVEPVRQLAVVACMDSRIDTFKILGMRNGEAHIVRNADGVITDDVIRSLCLSQRLLGTSEIILIHHTDCVWVIDPIGQLLTEPLGHTVPITTSSGTSNGEV